MNSKSEYIIEINKLRSKNSTYLQLKTPKQIYKGNKEVFKVYKGNTLVYNKLKYVLSQKEIISIPNYGGKLSNYINNSILSYKEDVELGNSEVGYMYLDIDIPINTSGKVYSGQFLITQNGSNLNLICEYLLE